MGEMIKLTASDGHTFDAYRAEPTGTPKGAIVVIQEIFGVNKHIREVTDSYAADGYLAISPAVFDRQKTGVELGYEGDDIVAGRDLKDSASYDDAVKDLEAAVAAVKSAGKVGTVGYCWGGTLSFLSGTRIDDVSASVVYYGGQIIPFKNEKMNAASLMHFGERDAGIPLDDVDAIKAAQPDSDVNVYPADHGFNCDHRGSYDEASCKLARERTNAFFAKHVG
ncbi:MAG: dienelactone hydrolase family protein [Alphaproteobacteria bacterium]|nr:dienelactone hydrolase family protein [Alphaproteobacteria bacterium]